MKHNVVFGLSTLHIQLQILLKVNECRQRILFFLLALVVLIYVVQQIQSFVVGVNKDEKLWEE